MSDEVTMDDVTWQYEVDSVQRGGVTGNVRARRHGKVSCPPPSDGDKPNNQHKEDEGGFDADGIPTGI